MDDFTNAMMMQTTPLVQLWMGWMVTVFLAALLFIRNHKQAKYTLLALIGTAFGGYILWTMTKNIHLLGIVHIIIWGPLAIYLWQSILSKRARRHDGAPDMAIYQTLKFKTFFYWVCLLFITLTISLIFDLRDIVLVMTGQK